MEIFKSFKHALNGIYFCFQRERNFRIHMVLAIYALFFSKYYGFTKINYIILFILFALVIGTEMINTAIEQFVDIETDAFNFRAKAAKDIAAGAVFVCAFISAVVGVLLYFDLEVFKVIVNDFCNNPIKLVGLVCSVVLSVLFVKFGVVKNNKI